MRWSFKIGLVTVITFFIAFFVISKIISVIDKQTANAVQLNVLGITKKVNPSSTPIPSPSPDPSPTPTPTPEPTATPKPTPTPEPTPTPVTASDMEEWFTKYSNKESINKDMLRKIALCESKMNPNAQANGYGGMFQFSESTWRSTRRAMNMDPNPKLRFNAEEAIKTAAFRFATVGYAAWPNCSK